MAESLHYHDAKPLSLHLSLSGNLTQTQGKYLVRKLKANLGLVFLLSGKS